MPRRKSYEIRVTYRYKRGKVHLRFRDPLTGEETCRVATKTTPSEIEREAWAWERELKENAAKKAIEKIPSNITWKKFREQFAEEHLLSLAEDTDKAFMMASNQFEKHSPEVPKFLKDLTASHISQFAAQYRKTGVSEVTIAQRLTHLKASLSWALSQEMIQELPAFPKVKRARKGQRIRPAKGRAICNDEFPPILTAVSKVVTSEHAGVSQTRWKRFLEGLWWGGLRLGECLDLSWDSKQGKIWVDLKRFSHPMLIIPADEEKGGKERVYPVSPEFAEILKADYREGATGRVFPLVVRRSKQNESKDQIGVAAASSLIREICREAKVFTHYSGQGEKRTQQPAGAQSFRRAFGERWARRVLPQVLQQMMRHENIETTMKYYVELQSEELAKDIYAAYDRQIESEGRPLKCPPKRTSKASQKASSRIKKH